jgi:hypothetical protein
MIADEVQERNAELDVLHGDHRRAVEGHKPQPAFLLAEVFDRPQGFGAIHPLMIAPA